MSENARSCLSRQRPAGLRLAKLGVSLVLSSSGCLVGPDFQRPAPPAVVAYVAPETPGSPSSAGTAGGQRIAIGERIPAQWWSLFHSTRLDELLRAAIASNHTLAAAGATLAQAREAILEARAGLYPRIDLGAGARRGAQGTGAVSNLFSLGPSVSYSLDAFGGTRRQVEQARALAESQQYELAAAYLTLTGNAVTESIAIASTRLEIATVEDLIANDQRNLDLVQRAFDAGRVARTEVLTAQAQLEADRTALPTLRQELSIARHALSILAGKAPGEWSPPEFEIQEFTLPGELPVSLPSQLVRQRPDILAAEALLHADSAAIGVATAQMYPAITLSASLTQQALALADLLRRASRIWSVGSDVETPLAQGGALRAHRRAAIDAYKAQLEIYRQTILQAFGQVADVLSAIEEDSALAAASQRALDIAAASLALQRSSYAAGKTSALQLIVAENTYSQARLAFARVQGQRLQDTAQLLVAVGGGWWGQGDALLAGGGPPAPP